MALNMQMVCHLNSLTAPGFFIKKIIQLFQEVRVFYLETLDHFLLVSISYHFHFKA